MKSRHFIEKIFGTAPKEHIVGIFSLGRRYVDRPPEEAGRLLESFAWLIKRRLKGCAI